MNDPAHTQASTPAPEAYWTAVGNIVRERSYGPGGAEMRVGSKHFAPGAKVYVIDWYAGMCERITVIGLHRKSKKFIRLVLDVKLVENLRSKLCYVPAVMHKIKEHYSPEQLPRLTQEFAETLCRVIPHWQAEATKPTAAPLLTLPLTRAAPSSVSPLPKIRSRVTAPGPQQPGSCLGRLWLLAQRLLKRRGK